MYLLSPWCVSGDIPFCLCKSKFARTKNITSVYIYAGNRWLYWELCTPTDWTSVYTSVTGHDFHIDFLYPISVSISVCRNGCNPSQFPYIGMYVHKTIKCNVKNYKKRKNYLGNRICRLTALHPQVISYQICEGKQCNYSPLDPMQHSLKGEYAPIICHIGQISSHYAMLATHVTSGTCLLGPKNGIFSVWPLFSNLRFRALIWRRAIDPISVARRVSGAEDHKNTIIVLIKIQKCMVVTIYVRNILTTDPYRKDGIFSL